MTPKKMAPNIIHIRQYATKTRVAKCDCKLCTASTYQEWIKAFLDYEEATIDYSPGLPKNLQKKE